jgi:dihydroorotate dehydrogenase (fumarate)
MKPQELDLATTYMGLRLKNPLVPSASPLSRDVSTVRALEDNGAAAIVMHSLFEEQIDHEAKELDHFLSHATESYAEALTYFPSAAEYEVGPQEYLENVRRIKEAVDIPVIASLNGVTIGGWLNHARLIEQAGADGLELNVYHIPTDPAVNGRQVEDLYANILAAVKAQVDIPVAMKLSPYFSAMAAMARRLEQGGANALVLFNRFYQPDIDLESLEVFPNLRLSTSHDMRLPMRWIAILRPHLELSLAATGGIDSAVDLVKMLMVGADVTMVCSTLLRHGPRRVQELLVGLREWLVEHEYESVSQLRGSMSHAACSDPSAFERANYMRALNSFK